MRYQLALLTLCLLILLLTNLFPRSLPEGLALRAEHLSEFGMQSQAAEVYQQLSQAQPDSIQWKVRLVESAQLSAQQVQSRYANQLYNLELRDGALFCLGYASLVSDKQPQQALRYFHKVHNRKLAGLSLYTGMAWAQMDQPDKALLCWRQEIADGGLSFKAVRMLGYGYVKSRNLDQVRALMDDPVTAPLVSDGVRRWRDLHDRRWLDYAIRSVRANFSSPPPAIAAALLIALMWVIVFRRIDLFEPEPAWATVSMFLLGACSCLWLLMPLSDLIIWFDPRYQLLNGPQLINTDPIFAIVHVGMLEELVKILPVFFFAAISRQFNEPLDWMIYGSLSALAFATLENIDYFSETPVAGMLARFTLCVIGHMTYTGIICYAWTRTRHFRGGSLAHAVATTVLAFLLASTLHGLYDFVPAQQKLLVGWLEAILYGRLLANALSHSPFYPEKPARLDRLRNEDLIESTGLLLLLIPYLWCNFSTSTELATQWLAANSWTYLLLITYFSTVSFLTLSRQRELWFSQPDEDERHNTAQRCLQMLRAVLVLTGGQYILVRAFEGAAQPITYLFVLAMLGLFWVYFRGAYGGLRSPLQWLAHRPSPPELAQAGFEEVFPPRRAGRWRSWLPLTAGPVLLAAMLLACATLLSEGQGPLPIALPLIFVLSPLAWVQPQFSAAWRHPTLPVWVWVFHNGRILLWSRLPEGQLITAAWISPWRVKPRRVLMQLFPGASLEQLLEQHTREKELQPLRELEEDLSDYVISVQAAFLAAPQRYTLRALWMTLTRQRAYISGFGPVKTD